MTVSSWFGNDDILGFCFVSVDYNFVKEFIGSALPTCQ